MTFNAILKSAIKDAVEEMPLIWRGSIFEELHNAKSDITGKFGERLLNDILSSNGFKVKWNEDKNTNASDGTYDLISNNKRIEVKTSFKNKSGGWQHENVYKEHVWDKITFIDVAPNGIYITVLNYEDLYFDRPHPILNRTPCLRDNHKSGYKFDFGVKTIQLGLRGGITFFWDLKNEEGLRKFLEEKFS